MKRLKLLGILGICLSSVLCNAQPTDSINEIHMEFQRQVEALSNITQVRSLIEGTGLHAKNLELQERQLAAEVAQTLRVYPHLLSLEYGKVAAKWFLQLPSRQPEHQGLWDQYLGYQILTTNDKDLIFLRLKRWGLEIPLHFQFLQDEGRITPDGEPWGFKQWTLKRGQAWIKAQNKILKKGEVSDFQKVFAPLLLDVPDASFIFGVYKYLVANQDIELRFKIIEFLLNDLKEPMILSFLDHLTRDVSLNDWMEVNPTLFRKLIQVAQSSPQGAKKFILAYGSREFLKGNFNIFETDLRDEGNHFWTEGEVGFNTGEQLMLSSVNFRRALLTHILNNQKKDWLLDYVGFAVEQNFTDLADLGYALGVTTALSDRRWPQWVMALDRDLFRQNLGGFTNKSALFEKTSPEFLEVHRLMAKESVNIILQGDSKPHFINPLKNYLNQAKENPTLYREIIFPLLADGFSRYEPQVWKPFCEQIISQMTINKEDRLILLDIIHKHRIHDLETLRMLNQAFGVPTSFESDLSRSKGKAVELEFQKMAFDQIYYEASQQGHLNHCKSLFSL